MRTGAFEGVDQHETAVGHLQNAFNFATEVGVAWGVDDINFHAHVVQGDVFCKNRDPAFSFQIIGVQNAVLLHLRLAELSACFDQTVDECRLAVVDVSNNGDISDVGTSFIHGNSMSGLPHGKRTRDTGNVLTNQPGKEVVVGGLAAGRLNGHSSSRTGLAHTGNIEVFHL